MHKSLDCQLPASARGVDVRGPSVKETGSGRRIPRRLLGAIAMVSLLIVAVVSIVRARRAARAARAAQGANALSDANTLLLAQQLDAVFAVLLERLPSEAELPASDQRLLRTWLQFDEQFLRRNATNRSLRFERATVHRRLGHGLFLLGERAEAVDHFRQATALLRELSRDYPTVVGYHAETADTYARLGWVMQVMGRPVEAASAYREALRLLTDVRLKPDPEREQRVTELYEQLAALRTPVDRSD